MAKGRANRNYKTGGLAGWTEYRYGSKQSRPITLPGAKKPKPILSKEKRQFVVDRVIDMMRPWQHTPFENEGAIRHGLRSGLCLAGHRWSVADSEAASIINEALSIIGIPRPTWEEGQPYYTYPRENCKWCYRSIDPADMKGNRNRLFCSDMCARSAYVHWDMKNASHGSQIEREAYRAVYREKFPDRICEQCGTSFKPKREKDDARFCSLRCFTDSLKIEIPERPCQHCGEIFTPSSSNVDAKFCSRKCADEAKRKFEPKPCIVCEEVFTPKTAEQKCCSVECAHQSKAFRQVEAVCQCCGETFIAKRVDAEYCSAKCARFAYRVTVGRIKRLSPPVFDYVFKEAA